MSGKMIAIAASEHRYRNEPVQAWSWLKQTT
jgi:hypothetical protein